MEKLILIDGNSLINRAFYATPLTLTDDAGNHTNAVYGFVNMLQKIIKEKSPTHMAVAFDLKAPTFRHEMYPEYKGTRKGMPEEMRPQFPVIKQLLSLMNIAIYEKEGLEADDILGTISANAKIPVEILTGDNDYLQLITENVLISITKKGISELESYTPEYLKEKMGLVPSQIVEMKSLMGDASDNIPGVRGIGEKTALKLLYEFETLDGVYANIETQKGKLKEKLEADMDMAYLSRKLAKINTNADFPYDYADMNLTMPFSAEVFAMMTKLRLKTLLKPEFFVENVAKNAEMLTVRENEEKFETVEIENLADLPNFTGDFAIYVDDSVEIFDGEKNYKIAVTGDMFGINIDEVFAVLKPALENENQIKTVYDYKKLKHILASSGVNLNGVKSDILLMQYVADFIQTIKYFEDVCTHFNVSTSQKGVALSKLEKILTAKLESENTQGIYFDMERPLADVLYEMEVSGFAVDKEKLEFLGDGYREKITKLEREIHELAGGAFNINSPKQLSKILFDDLLLTSGKKTKTGKSTGVEVLEEIQDSHPIVPKILEFRKYSKLLSTYVEGMKSQIEADGKIRTVFFQALTSTGRLSSREPNLQNIPIRTEEGKILRSVFIGSGENMLVSADYSQIELRLLAHFSGDETLVKAFNEGQDIHRATAAKVMGVPFEDVSADERRTAKAVNFGIIYGISAYGLAKQLGIFAKEATQFINAYFEQYSKVQDYMHQNVENAKQKGYAETYIGRKRAIREINSSNYNVRSFGERAAMNMPLQGSAADIIKIAMIRVSKSLKEAGLQAKLILQVHDELIIDTPPHEVEAVKAILKKDMENFDFAVPLDIGMAVGKDWSEAK
ncbi:MAG: DNA polymerase I [Bacillota bacterium]